MPVMGSAPVPAMRATVIIVGGTRVWPVVKSRYEHHAQRQGRQNPHQAAAGPGRSQRLGESVKSGRIHTLPSSSSHTKKRRWRLAAGQQVAIGWFLKASSILIL